VFGNQPAQYILADIFMKLLKSGAVRREKGFSHVSITSEFLMSSLPTFRTVKSLPLSAGFFRRSRCRASSRGRSGGFILIGGKSRKGAIAAAVSTRVRKSIFHAIILFSWIVMLAIACLKAWRLIAYSFGFDKPPAYFILVYFAGMGISNRAIF